MKTLFILSFFLTSVNFSNLPAVTPDTGVETERAIFPGGDAALQTYIGSELVYPSCARRDAIEGKVKVSFVVLPDGTIYGANIREGLTEACDREVIRFIEAMPQWQPASRAGKAVASKVKLSINFELRR